MSAPDTIYALATNGGRSAVAILRVSGPGAGAALDALAGARPAPRRAVTRILRDSRETEIDRALVLWFPAPASFTGEDVAELHVHGGRAVVDAVSEALDQAGARPARPGEFTRRAFENDKLDLTQAEAIADLVDAETQGQRDQALRQLRGGLGRLYEGWRARLVEALAWLEAEIDFPDEDGVPGGVAMRAAPILVALAEEMAAHLDDARRGERIREGFRIAIVGAPNVGKSALLNRIARRDAAIVAEIPGTTRDVIETRLALAGHLVTVLDTAGLRDTGDAVEREGVARALMAAKDADLRIGVVDAARPETLDEAVQELSPEDVLWINKTDLDADIAPIRAAAPADVQTLEGSASLGRGLGALEAALAEAVGARLAATEAPTLTRARHRRALEDARAALIRARGRLPDACELAAEDARLAARALGSITGAVDIEEVLDRIFADFCIGK